MEKALDKVLAKRREGEKEARRRLDEKRVALRACPTENLAQIRRV